MANTTISVPQGGISFTGADAYFVNSGDSKLVFTGYPPAVVYDNPALQPTTGSIGFTGYAPSRRTGLELTGYAPTLGFADNKIPGIDELTFTGYPPAPVIAAPPNKTIQPSTGSIGFTGYSSAVQVINTQPDTASLGLTGYAPNTLIRLVNAPRYPFYAEMTLTGQAIARVDVSQSGTSIKNDTATTDVPVNYQIDDRTGFKVKVKDVLVEEYTGHLVRPDSLDKRSQQEFIRSKSDGGKGPQRPEPVGDEDFIEDSYPNGVSSDDL